MADQTSSALTFDIAAHRLRDSLLTCQDCEPYHDNSYVIDLLRLICPISRNGPEGEHHREERWASGHRSHEEKGARMSDAEQLRLWREQLAREEDAEDSDDDGVGGYGVDDVHQPPDTDLGLALEDMPLPSRVPGGDDIRAAPPPRRVGRGPPSTGRPAPILGMYQ